ncbi:MAG TPA: DUF1343 domain-containing protein [Limnochordia bacterium]
MNDTVRPGIDVLLDERLELVRGRRIGLITHQAAVDRRLVPSIERLRHAPGVTVAALFGPEHGVDGARQAGESVAHQRDPRTGIPVYSLYGPTSHPTDEMLADLDALVCDLQDAGSRYWTIIATMARCMQAAARAGLPFILLDRPNPIGGLIVEGNVLDVAFRSSVGFHPIPMRHGLSLGELARLIDRECHIGADLTVVPAAGWRRAQHFPQTGLAWVPPSPNTPTPDTVLLYPGTCLIEGTTLSEGRGTTRPFELIGAPWLDPDALADALNRRDLPGVRFRPARFVPTFSKHQGSVCGGVQVHVIDRGAVRAVSVGLHLLDAARRQNPERFAWREPSRPGARPFIDLLAGTDRLRIALDRGVPPEDLLAEWEADRLAWTDAARAYWLYLE